MNYNYKLQSSVKKKLNHLRDKDNKKLFYYTFKIKNLVNHKSITFVLKKVFRDLFKQYILQKKDLEYLGVIETSSKLSRPSSLFEEDIIDLGLHLHLFVSVPNYFTYDTVRFLMVKSFGDYLIRKKTNLNLLIGEERTSFYDFDKFSYYHTKQFFRTRSNEFVVSNIK